MPPGVDYLGSWIEPANAVCYQVMKAEDGTLLNAWMEAWSDLVEFEVIPVRESGAFWADFDAKGS